MKSLEINSTPFTTRVVNGQVVAKAYIRGLADYRTVAEMTAEEAQSQAGAAQEAAPVPQSAASGGAP